MSISSDFLYEERYQYVPYHMWLGYC